MNDKLICNMHSSPSQPRIEALYALQFRLSDI